MRTATILILSLLILALPVAAQEFGSVAGSVSNADGDPIGNAVVTLTPADHGGGNRPLATVTDEEGLFGFERVVAGDYNISAMVPRLGRANEDVVVVANEETFVELIIGVQNGDDGEGGVTGTVADPDGNPIAAAEVMLMGDPMGGGPGGGRPAHFMTRSDRDGAFAFEGVPAGNYTINIGRFGYVPFQGEIEVVADEVVELEIVLQPMGGQDIEFGSVAGNVSDVENAPIELAHVMLMPVFDDENPGGRGPNGRHGWLPPLVAFTDADGNFEFEAVPVGAYTARAAKRGYVYADQDIEVSVDELTEVNFTLEAGEDNGGNGGNRGGHGNHRPEPVELHGWAIVVVGDRADIYLLDEDNDGEADYLLNFGPPDYEPENGAQRPEDGDEIDIAGSLVGHMDPPMVIVFAINDDEWRNPEDGGHGGRPGNGGGWGDREDPELVEADGFAIVNEDARWFNRYFLDVDDDGEADFRLCFGEEDYDPGNGAERPNDDDFVDIVGGQVNPPRGLPVIIVYQINGQMWREPGDTLGLFWEGSSEAVDERDVAAPTNVTLVSAYPNPFNPVATLSITLPEAGHVYTSLFDLQGREVMSVSNGYLSAGQHTFKLNGENLNAGTYFLRVDAAGNVSTQKVTLMK